MRWWIFTNLHKPSHDVCKSSHHAAHLKLILACLVAQSCQTLCDSVDCSLPGSSVHGIIQARILEWVATASSRGSSQPTQGLNPCLLHCRVDFLLLTTREASKRLQCCISIMEFPGSSAGKESTCISIISQ